MNTLADLDTVQVADAMSVATVTVSPNDRLEKVARLFSEHGINSAPVVDEFGRCLGIITSSDLVRYQSELPEANARISGGLSYEISRPNSDGSLELIPHPFDEVQRHMTTELQTIEPNRSIRLASKIMCQQHVHHLIVLDDMQHPVGILSSLDILAKLDR